MVNLFVYKLFKTSLNSVVLVDGFQLLISGFMFVFTIKTNYLGFIHFLKTVFAHNLTQLKTYFIEVKKVFTHFTQPLLLLLNILNNSKTIRSVQLWSLKLIWKSLKAVKKA